MSSAPKRLTAAQIRALEADAKSARAAAEKLQAERDKLQGERDDLRARLAASEKAVLEVQAQAVTPLEASLEALKTLFTAVELPLPRKNSSEAFAEKLKTVMQERAQTAEAAKALREQTTALEKQLKETAARLTSEASDNDKIITQLIEENRRLATQVDEITADAGRFREVAESANAEVKAAREETDKRVRAELAADIKQLNTQRGQLETQIASLNKQLQSQGKQPVLTPDQVANVIGGLVDGLGGSLGGLAIRDGELKLKVGFAGVDQTGGFVIPTPDSKPELRENLHEVTLRFDRPVLK